MSNQFQIHIYWYFFLKLVIDSLDSSKTIRNFSWLSLERQPVLSVTQPPISACYYSELRRVMTILMRV